MIFICMAIIITFCVGWLAERIALFCDFTLPAIQEARYKKQVFKKYGNVSYKSLIGLKGTRFEDKEKAIIK